MNFIKKTLIYLVIFSLVVPTDFVLALFPTPTEAMNQVMNDLGVDKDELKKTLNDTIDVANFKKNPPAVTLSFVPESPVPGKELTAVATPSYFTGNPNQMYFTWYLKHKECEEAKKGNNKYESSCDLNEDDKVDVEDWKIEAMKLLARGNTEEVFDYSSDDDDDGYDAVFGGDDQRGKPAHCYVRDIASGVDYEIGVPGEKPEDDTKMRCEHIFPDTHGHGTIGDGEFGKKEEEFWGTNPHSKDTNNDGVPDEEALTGKGMMQLKWTFQQGDRVGVAVEGVQENTDYPDSSYKTMWALSKGTCEITTPNIPVQSKDERNVFKFYGYHGCDFPETATVSVECSNIENPETFGGSFSNPLGTGANCHGPTEKTDPECSGIAFLPCSAIPPGGNDCGRCYLDPSTFSLWKGGGGDSFLALVLDSSLGDATCEACVINSTGAPFQFPRGCDDDGDLSDCTEIAPDENVMCAPWKGKMSYEEPPRASSDTDINDCLGDNLVDPAQGTADKKIEVGLSYAPQYPILDPNGDNADELTIKANLSNVENKSFAKYVWSLWNCPDKTGEDCDELDRTVLDPQKTTITKTLGLGLDSLKLKLFMPAMPFLKIALEVTEDTDQTAQKRGEGSVIIPLQKFERSVTAYSIGVKIDTSSEAGLRLELLDPRTAACSGKICPVVQNEIIGLKAPEVSGYDLAWYLNGKPILTPENSKTAYFPVLQSADFKYSVRLDLSKDKEKISLLKDFKVEDPKVTITSEECDPATGTACKPLLLGKFIDPTDPKKEELMVNDYSQDVFQVEKDAVITFQPAFNFDASVLMDTEKNRKKINWFVDGKLVDTASTDPKLPQIDADGNLRLPVEKEVDEKYNLSVEAVYTQSEINKRALNKIWNNPKNFFYATTVSDSAEIEVIAAPEQASVGAKKIMASLFSLLPDYINFLFRIVLTIGLILFSTGLLLSVFPKQKERQM